MTTTADQYGHLPGELRKLFVCDIGPGDHGHTLCLFASMAADRIDELEAEVKALKAAMTPTDDLTLDEQITAAVGLVAHHPGVEHIWLNAFSCVSPTDGFAAEVGRTVIDKVMAHRHDDVFKRRHIVLRINAS